MKLAQADAIKRPQYDVIDYARYANLGMRLRNRCLRRQLRRLMPRRTLISGLRQAFGITKDCEPLR